ncbi:hypothetical protein C7Y66_09820 [Chroococcidiopsis sp. CCALA 051]|uniref:hypothetical protein n=1 Tax=Chroococcidiopsis sp. CCALA 051 TaxID=869949 RepID=UPI000D0D85C4|nr:hypothetical protein [Chroococcidiopsis sp. CCALA 051]PSM49300.1 hypothetical protein C7Y66_09820 [Chroococcidiopsis sp. CCALA 051]
MMYSNHHPKEQDYWCEQVEVETSDGQTTSQETYLLRVYPEAFNGCDAYMDIPKTQEKPEFKKVHASRLGITWEVIDDPSESPINGIFRGDYTMNNPPAWIFGLRKLQ